MRKIGSSNGGGVATIAPVYKGGMALPEAEIGIPYSVDLSEYFTNAVEEYMLQTGSLPGGFALNPVTCILSGTSWEYSSQPISIRATHSVNGGAISAIVDFIVNYPESTPAPVATIMTDAETLPEIYRSTTSGYFKQDPASNGYTGITTYEGYAPHPVYFSGWTSTTFLDIKSIVWDFGAGTESDYGGRYFTGINAAHVFETAGNYTVTLTVTDLFGRISTATRDVIIHAGGIGNTSIYGGHTLNTYYVDPVNGLDTYDGKSQTVDGGNVGPWQTFDKVINMLRKSNVSAVSTWPLKPGDKVFLKRGETFNISSAIATFGHGQMCQGVHIGAYGTGDKPIIQWQGTANPNENNFIFNCSGLGAGLITFTDIVYNFRNGTTHTLNGAWYSLETSRNIAFLRCDFRDPKNTSVSTGPSNAGYYTNEAYGTFLIGCTANQANSADTATVLFYYGSSAALCLIGNTADQSGNHINYIQNSHGGVITDNTFSRPAFGRTALRITGGPLTSPAEKIYVARNKMLGWIDPVSAGSGAHNGGGTRYNFRLANLSHNSGTLFEEHINDIIYERNIFTNFESGLSITNTRNLLFRNNILVTPSPLVGECIVIGDNTTFQKRPSENIHIYNNTLVYNGSLTNTKVPFVRIYGTSGTGVGYHPGLEIRNNNVISIAGRQDLFLKFQENNASQFANMVASNNLLDSPYANWVDIAGTEHTLANWQTNQSQDTNSLKTTAGVTTAPTLVTHSPGFPDSSAACVSEADAYVTALKPDVGSALIAAGYNDVPVYVDYEGMSRPLSSKDIGSIQG